MPFTAPDGRTFIVGFTNGPPRPAPRTDAHKWVVWKQMAQTCTSRDLVGMGGDDPGNPCDQRGVPWSGLSKKMGARAKGRAGKGMGGWKVGPTPSPGRGPSRHPLNGVMGHGYPRRGGPVRLKNRGPKKVNTRHFQVFPCPRRVPNGPEVHPSPGGGWEVSGDPPEDPLPGGGGEYQP